MAKFQAKPQRAIGFIYNPQYSYKERIKQDKELKIYIKKTLKLYKSRKKQLIKEGKYTGEIKDFGDNMIKELEK